MEELSSLLFGLPIRGFVFTNHKEAIVDRNAWLTCLV